MNAINFLSSGTYLVLPLPSSPKVYLSIDSGVVSKKSFELYNPFSFKAKLLKQVAKLLCIHLNFLAKRILPTFTAQQSDFIIFLENKISKKIKVSAYLATANDKIVLQIICENKIYGYLKFPISQEGIHRVLNEKKAIEIFANKNLIAPILMDGEYNKSPFIILENIAGEISDINNNDYKKVLVSFQKTNTFLLYKHPRIIQLENKCKNLKLNNLQKKLGHICEKSTTTYKEVLEHGDFAPWNLIKTKERGLIAFDFEYFHDNGLEFLDELKYHYQVENLLKKKKGEDLLLSLKNKLDIIEFEFIFSVFLIKEICNKEELAEDYSQEEFLLNLL